MLSPIKASDVGTHVATVTVTLTGYLSITTQLFFIITVYPCIVTSYVTEPSSLSSNKFYNIATTAISWSY